MQLRVVGDAERKRLELELAQAEAAARLEVIRTEMEARKAQIAILIDETGSASTLQRTDEAVLRKMRHADVDNGVTEISAASARNRRKGGR